MRIVHITLSSATDTAAAAPQALALLPHTVTRCSPELSQLLNLAKTHPRTYDAAILDATEDLNLPGVMAQRLSMADFRTPQNQPLPLLIAVTEGSLVAATSAWQATQILVGDASPAEVQARLRLAVETTDGAQAGVVHTPENEDEDPAHIFTVGSLHINTDCYSATLSGKPLDLTYKEFELLRFLLSNPEKVFTRDQLLQEVWGYDYYGGTRTVDVHIRRLRAKLGPDLDASIATVRNVGYWFNPKHREEHET